MLTLASGLLGQVFLGVPNSLLSVAIIFFIIAILAYVLGAQGVAGMSAGIGRMLLIVFLVLFVVTLLVGFLNRPV